MGVFLSSSLSGLLPPDHDIDPESGCWDVSEDGETEEIEEN